jgi:ubiquinone/menaquinone biosynthesis C-methylase UbiE
MWRRIAGIAHRPWFFRFSHMALVGRRAGLKQLVRRHLPGAGHRVLDAGCGIGDLADLVDGEYVGVDASASYIEYARRHHGGRGQRTFVVGDITNLPFPDRHFETSMIVNCLHHLSDHAVTAAVSEIRRVTRGAIIIVDADATPRAAVPRLLMSLDLGSSMRTADALAGLIRQSLAIDEQVLFRNGPFTLALFHCRAERP